MVIEPVDSSFQVPTYIPLGECCPVCPQQIETTNYNYGSRVKSNQVSVSLLLCMSVLLVDP